jgi:LPXTG-site transpeptidase (sortase) family protein
MPALVTLPYKKPRTRLTFGWIPVRIHNLKLFDASVFADRKRFVFTWTGSFAILLVALIAMGFVPKGVSEPVQETVAALTLQNKTPKEQPVADFVTPTASGPEIAIPAVGIHAGLVFPKSTNVDALNNALTAGVVHYPESPRPGEVGNVFLFGHSTGLKVVHNKNFEALNNLKNVKPGDAIRVRYDSRDYLYVVQTVRGEKAGAAKVDFNTKEKILTLSTCNVWGGHEARTVVEAKFVRSYPVRSVAAAPDTSL